jgi:hypothetical protein
LTLCGGDTTYCDRESLATPFADERNDTVKGLAFLLGLLLGLAAGYGLATRREFLTTPGPQRSTRELDSLTRDELYRRAQAQDIPGRSSMSKEELHDALVAVDTFPGEGVVHSLRAEH